HWVLLLDEAIDADLRLSYRYIPHLQAQDRPNDLTARGRTAVAPRQPVRPFYGVAGRGDIESGDLADLNMRRQSSLGLAAGWTRHVRGSRSASMQRRGRWKTRAVASNRWISSTASCSARPGCAWSGASACRHAPPAAKRPSANWRRWRAPGKKKGRWPRA